MRKKGSMVILLGMAVLLGMAPVRAESVTEEEPAVAEVAAGEEDGADLWGDWQGIEFIGKRRLSFIEKVSFLPDGTAVGGKYTFPYSMTDDTHFEVAGPAGFTITGEIGTLSEEEIMQYRVDMNPFKESLECSVGAPRIIVTVFKPTSNKPSSGAGVLALTLFLREAEKEETEDIVEEVTEDIDECDTEEAVEQVTE